MTPAVMQELCDRATAECTDLRAEIDLQTVEIGKQRTAITALGETIATMRVQIDGYELAKFNAVLGLLPGGEESRVIAETTAQLRGGPGAASIREVYRSEAKAVYVALRDAAKDYLAQEIPL